MSLNEYKPLYLNLDKNTLKEKYNQLIYISRNCKLCPNECGVDRFKEKGFCQTGRWTKISSFAPHFGEEPPLVGKRGSGTIFFSNCNLKCIFCQNYSISHLGEGEEVSDKELADIILYLASIKVHNINFVTPTHVIPQIIGALLITISEGLDIPLVYNTGGYDSLEVIKILQGVIDIYMPDMKYGDSSIARELSGVNNYKEVNFKVVKEMYNQVGDLVINEQIAKKGLLIRHLVLPNRLANTEEVCKFISNEISKNTYINIMDQYRPCYKAYQNPLINRRIYSQEYQEALNIAYNLGLHRGICL